MLTHSLSVVSENISLNKHANPQKIHFNHLSWRTSDGRSTQILYLSKSTQLQIKVPKKTYLNHLKKLVFQLFSSDFVIFMHPVAAVRGGASLNHLIYSLVILSSAFQSEGGAPLKGHVICLKDFHFKHLLKCKHLCRLEGEPLTTALPTSDL